MFGLDEYMGVSLVELAGLAGGLDAVDGSVGEASDASRVEFTETQLRGEGFTGHDPESGAEVAATRR